MEAFFLQKTKTSFVYQKQNLWIKNAKGFLVLVEVLVQPFYDQIEGLQSIAYIKHSDKFVIKDFNFELSEVFVLITDPNGMIH